MGDIHKGESDTARLEPDTIFDILSHRRCRLLLWYLHDVEYMVRSELAHRIIASEQEAGHDRPVADHYYRILGSLHHDNLSRMVDAKVITYDRLGHVVQPTEYTAQLYPFLELVTQHGYRR